MLERLSEKFAGKLIRAGVIAESDADVYRYGFFQCTMLILNVLTALLLGVLFQQLLLCILLNAAYIPIRMNAGGHHAKSPLRCYVNSTAMIAILMAMIKWIPFYPVIFFILLVLSSLCIWCFAPVETENNPLDSLEKKIYRRRSRAVLLAEIVASLLLFTFTRYQIATVIVLALFTEAIMLLYGILTQPRKSN